MSLLQKSLFAAACVVVPIVWGWLVHRFFAYLERQRRTRRESTKDDYQI